MYAWRQLRRSFRTQRINYLRSGQLKLWGSMLRGKESSDMGYIPETYTTPIGERRRWNTVEEARIAAKQEWEPLLKESKYRWHHDAYKTYVDPRGNERATVDTQGNIEAGVDSERWRI